MIVLRDVDLDVDAGEFIAIVGSNAAGKSTLIRAIIGLLPRIAGTIEFETRRVDRMPPYALAELGIAVVLEHSIIAPLSVYDNLVLGACSEARPSVRQTLEAVFALFPVLAERQGQPSGSLSGGEQQMLCIGRALMSRPKMLLLDEPSVGLSPVMVSTILKALSNLNRQGLTILVVEQDIAQTLKVVSRAYVLESGCIVLHAPAAELMANPAVKQAYLGI